MFSQPSTYTIFITAAVADRPLEEEKDLVARLTKRLYRIIMTCLLLISPVLPPKYYLITLT